MIYYLYFAALLSSFITSILNWQEHQREDKILSLLLLSTFISESIAEILARTVGNNLIVFHVFSPLQFFLISLYFNNIITSFRKNQLGAYIGTFGVLLSITNSIFFQNISTFNNFYILFEALAIIFMTLNYFLEIIQKESLVLLRNKHFWVAVTFLFFWSVTYTYWALTNIILANGQDNYLYMSYIISSINIITYGGLSAIFILNKKNILHNEY